MKISDKIAIEHKNHLYFSYIFFAVSYVIRTSVSVITATTFTVRYHITLLNACE